MSSSLPGEGLLGKAPPPGSFRGFMRWVLRRFRCAWDSSEECTVMATSHHTHRVPLTPLPTAHLTILALLLLMPIFLRYFS